MERNELDRAIAMGAKIRRISWTRKHEYIQASWYDESNNINRGHIFRNPNDWELYVEPTPDPELLDMEQAAKAYVNRETIKRTGSEYVRKLGDGNSLKLHPDEKYEIVPPQPVQELSFQEAIGEDAGVGEYVMVGDSEYTMKVYDRHIEYSFGMHQVNGKADKIRFAPEARYVRKAEDEK